MTREEQTISNLKKLKSFHNGSYGTDIDRAIKALEQEPCEDWYDVPSNEMTLGQARQAVKDLRKKLKEHLEQEPCDEYGNYKYPNDIELTEPNTATSIPCGDAIRRQTAIDAVKQLPSAQLKQTNCEYCHPHHNGRAFPLEENSYALFIDHDKIVLKANGWRGEAKIKYCPICGRRLTDG